MEYHNLVVLTTSLTLLVRLRQERPLDATLVLGITEATLCFLTQCGVRERLPPAARRELLKHLNKCLMPIELCINHHADAFPRYDLLISRSLRSGVQYLIEDYLPLVQPEEERRQWRAFVDRMNLAKYDQQLREAVPDEHGADAPGTHWWWD